MFRKYIYYAALFIGICGLSSSCKDDNTQWDASGTFEATEVMVSAEASGRIETLDVREGDKVRCGQVCGLIDTVQLHLQKLQIEAGIKAAEGRTRDVETQTAYLKEQIAVNKKEISRLERLIEANAANTKQLDDANAGISLLEKQLQAAIADIRMNNTIAAAEALSLKAQLAQVEEAIRRSRIISPIDGTILVKYAQKGELTGAGKPIFKIADIENMYLRAYVTSAQLDKLKIGQKVTVMASGDKKYEGVISWIAGESEFTPKTIQTKDERTNLVYAVKIAFVNDGYAKIGMYGDVVF